MSDERGVEIRALGDEKRQAAVSVTREDRDRTLEAIRGLERALGRAAAGRGWAEEARRSLDALEAAMIEEQRELNRPDSLLGLVVAHNPRRFEPRIRHVRDQYAGLIQQVTWLRKELASRGDNGVDASDLRQRAGWIIRALHHCRARQTDAVYEALELDLGREAADP